MYETLSISNEKDISSNISRGIRSNEEDKIRSDHSRGVAWKVPQQNIKLWEKAEIKNLKIVLEPEKNSNVNENNRFEIDLLSNDVENILIEKAFKIQKLEGCGRQSIYMNMGSPMNPYPMYQNYFNYQQPYFQPTVNEDIELHQLRRSFNLPNLVETRKTQSRLGGNKYS